MEKVCANHNCRWNNFFCSTGQRFVKVITSPINVVGLSLIVNSASIEYEEMLIERFLIKNRSGVTVVYLCETCHKL